MIFLLNFTQFDAIIANFETHFAYFETKSPDRFGRGYSHLQAHTRRGSQCSQDCRGDRCNQLYNKLSGCVKYIKIPSPTNFSPFSFFISH